MGRNYRMKFIKQYEQTEKRKGRLPLHVYLTYLLVCTFLLSGVTFSRYISSANGSDSARAAAGVVTVSYDEQNTVFEMTPPYDYGVEERTFQFQVSNANSEVAVRYDIAVTLDKPLAAGVTMTLDGRVCSGNSSNTYTFSNMGTFAAGEAETRTHTLLFKGNFMEISEGTNDTYQVEISIRSQQID